MIFRQLFEPVSSTYTYLVGCEDSRQAVLVDPVMETAERDLACVRQLDLRLAFTLETHIHADHVTSALRLKTITGSRIAMPANAGVQCADVLVDEDHPLEVGSVTLQPLFTPGHTAHHHCYVITGGAWRAVLSGDALLIDGCGRTDFQGGDSDALFRSVKDKLFTLPAETLVYPGHDYKGRHVSSIAQERRRNPRLGDGKREEEFAQIMDGLNLPYPKMIDLAVPANMACGLCPDAVRDIIEESLE